MKGYKAFKKGLICDPTGHKPYQYAENTVFEQKEDAYIPICVKTEQIDGEKIKEDTFYKLENGEFVECEG